MSKQTRHAALLDGLEKIHTLLLQVHKQSASDHDGPTYIHRGCFRLVNDQKRATLMNEEQARKLSEAVGALTDYDTEVWPYEPCGFVSTVVIGDDYWWVAPLPGEDDEPDRPVSEGDLELSVADLLGRIANLGERIATVEGEVKGIASITQAGESTANNRVLTRLDIIESRLRQNDLLHESVQEVIARHWTEFDKRIREQAGKGGVR